VIVTGDVNTAKAMSWVAARFGGWKRGADPFATPIPEVPPLKGSTVLIVPADVPHVAISVQWHGPSARTDIRNTYVADVFSDMMNTSVSSFHERLVLSGLFQGLGVNYYTQGYSGPISVGGVTSVQRVERAIPALRDEIARFGDRSYLTADLFQIAKKRRAVQTEYGLERGSGLAHSLAFWWSVTGLDYFRGYVDTMRGVTLDELHAYVARYIVGKPYVVTAVIPRGTEGRIGPLIQAAFGVEGTR
jgi:zinc protease